MNEEAITRYITENFEGVDIVTSQGNTFFMYDPQGMFSMATLVTNDDYDQFSNLNRPSAFRLNIGVSKQTFLTLFGPPTRHAAGDQAEESNYDFTALNQLMPHPVYGRQYWVSILNPSPETFQTVVQPLLAEAYNMAVNKYKNKKGSTAQP